MRTKAAFVGNVIVNTLVGLFLLIVTVTSLIPLIIGATPLTVMSGSMEPTISVGDIVIVKPVKAETLRIGDTITFQPISGESTLITHRIVEKAIAPQGLMFTTLGDNNDQPDRQIAEDQVQGKVIYIIPFVGQLALVGGLEAQAFVVLGIALALAGVLWVIFSNRREKDILDEV